VIKQKMTYFIYLVALTVSFYEITAQCNECDKLKSINFKTVKDSLISKLINKNELSLIFNSTIKCSTIKIIYENKNIFNIESKNGLCLVDGKKIPMKITSNKIKYAYLIIDNKKYLKILLNIKYSEVRILFINGNPCLLYTNDKYYAM